MPPFLVKNKPASMSFIETGDKSLAVPLNLHAFACPSRSNKRYALTQQSRRKLLAFRRWLSQLGRDKRPAASACFHQPQALCGIQVHSRLRHSFCIRLGLFYARSHRLSSLFFTFAAPDIVLSLYFARYCFSLVFPLFFASDLLDKPGGTCYLFIHKQMR